MKSVLTSIMLALIFSLVAVAAPESPRGSRENTKTDLTSVKWIGDLLCNEKKHSSNHKLEHDCELVFVNVDDGAEWSVKSNSTLKAIHQKFNTPVKVHVEALSSPRYLLGSSYLEVKKIEILPPVSTGKGVGLQKETAKAHVCALSNTPNVN